MKMHEQNPEKEKIVLLLHPMLSEAEAMKLFIADYLGEGYHYLIPDLSAHGDAKDQTYQSSALEAKAIYEYLQQKQIQTIDLAFGASLGGVVLFELLKYPQLTVKTAFFEGASFQEHAPLVNLVTKAVFLSKHRKAVADPQLAVRKMSKIYGQKAAKPMADRFIAMSEESIKNIVYDCAYVNLPELSPEMQKHCVFAFGEKDSDLKKARKVQPAKYPHAILKIWRGYDHCVRMTEAPAEYAEMLRQYLR